MLTDNELLDTYARHRSESAFRELVERRTRFVYSIAMRHVGGQAHLAQEVTQAVFTDLARKAASVSLHPALQGWLFKSAYFSATSLLRAERRRVVRETEAHAMQTPAAPEESVDWQKLGPALDEAVNALNEKDREAILLRFVHGYDFAAVGTQLRLSEEGARARANRALDKMRARLIRRGITSTTTALGLALGGDSLLAVPAGFASKVATAALLGSGASTVGLFSILTWSSLTTAVGVLAVAAGGLLWKSQYETNRSLQRELETLRPVHQLASNLRLENDRRRREQAAQRNTPVGDATLGQRLSSSDEEAAMIPVDWLRPLDGATPVSAFEALYWAKEHVDVGVLEKRIELTPVSRERAANYYAHLPDAVKRKFSEVTSPEGMIALAWAMSPAVSALRLDQLIENDHDAVTLIGKVRCENQRLISCELQLVHSVNGWRWRPSEFFVNEMLDAISKRLRQP